MLSELGYEYLLELFWIVLSRLAGLGTVYFLSLTLYNVYFHPLSKFPGPMTSAASRIPFVISMTTGRFPYKLRELHATYGDVVRIAPNELIFAKAEAWKDIYGLRPARPGMPKDPIAYPMPPDGVHSILSVNDYADHSRYRRLLAHGFSEKALREQESLIRTHIDLLISKLRGTVNSGAQNMVDWYNFIAFDIIADLALGESFGCLEKAEYHPWVSTLFSGFKVAAFVSALNRVPPLNIILMSLIPKSSMKQRMQQVAFAKEKISHRKALKTDRPDFMSYVLRHNEKETGMSDAEIHSTFRFLLVAGSETSATALSAATFYLLKNPQTMKKLVSEIRGSFGKEEEINMVSVNKLKYEAAVLDEAMRLHPPTPNGFPRLVPGKGDTIGGHWVPGGTTVSIDFYGSFHYGGNFQLPDSFIPERWLDDQRFVADNKAIFQPFSAGPRNCIGQNLANAEMRLVLARVLWNFDLTLTGSSSNWVENMKAFILWEKPPLYVKLSRAKHDGAK